jgi:tetratricopeptide (TPR) repeat protein
VLGIRIAFVGLLLCTLHEGLLSQQPTFESLLASAQQAQARSDFESAANFYRQAVAIHPENAELRANLGLMYYQTGKDDQAIDAFRQAILLKPALFVPQLFLGLDYIKSKRFNDAIPYLKRASLLNSSDVQSHLALGQAYSSTGETRPAIAAYLRAAQLAPANADAWYHLGLSYLQQVEADARVLLARHKGSSYLQVLMADNFSEQHAFVQADEAYKKALSSPPFPPGTHAGYGFVLLSRHDLPGAEREFKSELAVTPGSLMAKVGLARLHLEQGTTEEAAKDIGQIWTADAGFFRANASVFHAGLSQSKRSELQHVLEERQANGELSPELVALFRPDVADEGPTPISTTFNTETTIPSTQGRIGTAGELYAEGRYRQCSNALSSRLQALPSSELRTLTFCAYSTGDHRRAFDAAARMAVNAPTEAEGLYWETKSAQRLATEALTHASAIDSTSPKLHILLGDIYRQRKSFPDAEQEYRKALALQPGDNGALFGLSLALLADDQRDEASQVTQTALKNSPDDPELNAVMGEILCARNDFPGAEPYLKKGLNTKPEYVPHVHALLGKVYAHTGRTAQAISELKLALADDKDGTVHYQIARLYLKVGDRDSAKQAFDVSQRLRSEGLNRATVAMQQGEDDDESQ